MVSFFSYLLLTVTVLFSIPVTILLIEISSAVILTPRIALRRSGERQRIAVLVPAHNESATLLPTVQDVRAQLTGMDRIIVIADNCIDDTATVAATSGAEVVQRHDLKRMGKGYALDYGIQFLAANPPEVLIIVDADCRLAPNTLEQLSILCASTGRPVQSLDLMLAPENAPASQRVAEFAWRVKNWVRPLGLSALDLPCQLMGTGMAFPWNVIKTARVGSADIAEDLQLGLELALAGHPALFCPTARVESYFPSSKEAALEQRRRWEQGHLTKILRMAPPLIRTAFKRRNLGLLVLALDLAVPPLTLLGMLLIALLIASSVSDYLGLSSIPLMVSFVTFILYLLSIVLCWLTHGRDALPLRGLLALALFAADKLRLYGRMSVKQRLIKWERTDRKR